MEETRIAIVSVIVEEPASVMPVNELLHGFAAFVIGRMGLPCRERGISIISLVMDAPEPVVNNLCGKLGMLAGVKAKALFGKNVPRGGGNHQA